MEALLEKYLPTRAPEGDGGGGAAGGDGGQQQDKSSLLQVQPKPMSFDLSAIGADMNDDPEATKSFVIEEENKPTFPDQQRDLGQGEEEGDDDAAGDDKGEDGKAADGDGKKPDDKAKPAEAKKGEEGELEPWVKRRLDRQQRKHEREMAELRAKVDAKEGGKAQADDPGPAPKAEDFPDFEEYMEAKTAHEGKVKAAEKAKAEQPKKDDTKAAGPDHELAEALEDIQDALAKTAPDLWAKVSTADIQFSRDMALAVTDLDHPHVVLQYLMDNPEESAKIAALPPHRQAVRLAKLDKPAEAKPATKKPETQQQVAQRRSEAPAPIEPVDGKATVDKGYNTGDFREYERQRSEEEAARGKVGDFW